MWEFDSSKNNKNVYIYRSFRKEKTATAPISTGFVAVLSSYNCQRWEYNRKAYVLQCFDTPLENSPYFEFSFPIFLKILSVFLSYFRFYQYNNPFFLLLLPLSFFSLTGSFSRILLYFLYVYNIFYPDINHLSVP